MVLLRKCKIHLKLSKIVISNLKLPNKVSIYMFGEVRNPQMLLKLAPCRELSPSFVLILTPTSIASPAPMIGHFFLIDSITKSGSSTFRI